MKRLTCEMCGGTDLIKQDGVFVCQSCGCKYSVEEAKKMMVEGTVEVTGTVKLDKNAELAACLRLFEDAYTSGNLEYAYKHASRATEIDPASPDAWLAKMRASEYWNQQAELAIRDAKSSFAPEPHDFKSKYWIECSEAARQAIQCAGQNVVDDVTEKVYEHLCLCLTKWFSDECADPLKANYNTCFKVYSIVARKDPSTDKHTSSIKREVFALENAEEFLSAPVISRSDKLTKLYKDFVSAYKEKEDSYIDRFRHLVSKETSITTIMIESARNKMKIYEDKAALIDQLHQKQYWNGHPEEYAQLSDKKKELEGKIENLQKKILEIRSNEESESLAQEIAVLSARNSSLGLFKLKEKKELDKQIKELQSKKTALDAEIDCRAEEIQSDIEPLEKQLSEINDKLALEK